MSTQTLVSTATVAPRSVPVKALVKQLIERIVGFRQARAPTIDVVVARAVDEAFESLWRETRS